MLSVYDALLLMTPPAPHQDTDPDQARAQQQEQTRRWRNEHPNAAQRADAHPVPPSQALQHCLSSVATANLELIRNFPCFCISVLTDA